MSVAWPQYDSEEKQYMELSSQRAVKQQDTDLLRRVNFWINKWPKITVPEETYRQKGILLMITSLTFFKGKGW